MRRIFVPSRGADDWRQCLADPEKQWRDGYSAKCLASVPDRPLRADANGGRG